MRKIRQRRYTGPARTRRARRPPEQRPLSGGTHLAFRWMRFNRTACDLAVECWYALRAAYSRIFSGSDKPSQARQEQSEARPGEPSGWAGLLPWLTIVGLMLALYYGFTPVRNIVDRTAGEFVQAVNEELSENPSEGEREHRLDMDDTPSDDFETDLQERQKT